MPADIEEERRLFYVAMTRAEKGVTLSYASNRMRWGKSESNDVSRFLREIDSKYLSGSVPSRSGARAASNAAMGAAFGRQFGASHYGGRSSYGAGHPAQPAPQRPSAAPAHTAPPHAPVPGFTPDPVSSLKVGQRVEHDRFGFGTILSFDGDGAGMKAVVKFEDGSTKTLLLKFAKLRAAQ